MFQVHCAALLKTHSYTFTNTNLTESNISKNMHECIISLITLTKFIVLNIRTTTLEYKDIGIRKSEFVVKTQFLSTLFKIER